MAIEEFHPGTDITVGTSFAELFTDTETPRYYRLWTGNIDETGNVLDGSLVDTPLGNGWATSEGLADLKVGLDQAGHNTLYVLPYHAHGRGQWAHSNDFAFPSAPEFEFTGTKTSVSGDTPLNEMFDFTAPVESDSLWFQLKADGESIETDLGSGWVRADRLGQDTFPEVESGEELSVLPYFQGGKQFEKQKTWAVENGEDVFAEYVHTYSEFQDALTDNSGALGPGDKLIVHVSSDIGPEGFKENGPLSFEADHGLVVSGEHVLSADNASPILELNAPGQNLTVKGLTLKGGDYGDGLPGGAVWAHGADVDLSEAEFEGNATDAVIRGSSQVDVLQGSGGDDNFVVVGDLRGENKTDSGEDSRNLGEKLTVMVGKDFNEDADGAAETILGGEGDDTLYVYGEADISDYELSGIEHIKTRSDVTFSVEMIDSVEDIEGDGGSVIRIKSMDSASDGAKTIDVSGKMSGMSRMHLGEGVSVEVGSREDLGGADRLSGEGTVRSREGTLDASGLTREKGVTLENADGTEASGASEVEAISEGGNSGGTVTGTSGDDLLMGGNNDENFIPKAGKDTLIGQGGDDVYRLVSGEKTIVDSSGMDTLDFSDSGTALNIELGKSVNGTNLTVNFGGSEDGGGTDLQPVDIFLVEDLSGSFGDDVSTIQGLVDTASASNTMMENLRDVQSDTQFGLGSFIDKPTGGFGASSDYVYRTEQPIRRDETLFEDSVNDMDVGSGADGPEAQLSALQQIALRADTEEIGFREGALRTVVLTTDAPYHEAGDFSSVPANNSDPILDGDPPGTGEDYPSVDQVRSAVESSGIYPIFAVTDYVKEDYQALVKELGVGDVVELASDSSNITDSVETALGSVQRDFIENVTGTAEGDEISGNGLDNIIFGGDGDDVLRGGSGTDILLGGNGLDTAKFAGELAEYVLSADKGGYDKAGYLHIQDQVSGRDDLTKVTASVEELEFSDRTVLVADKLPESESKGIDADNPFMDLARFAQAAYSGDEGKKALGTAEEDGWTPLKPASGTLVPAEAGDNPWYDSGNAQALVAGKGDTLVLSFRGTDEAKSLGALRGMMEYILKEEKGYSDSDLDQPYLDIMGGAEEGLTEFGTALKKGAAAIQSLYTGDVHDMFGNVKGAAKSIKEAYNEMDATLESMGCIKEAGDTLWDFADTMRDGVLGWWDEIAGTSVKATALLRYSPHPIAAAVGKLAHAAEETGEAVNEVLEYGIKTIGMASLADWGSLGLESLESVFARDDSYHWIEQQDHYQKFEPLTATIKTYLSEGGGTDIDNLYVTGHSLGAGMVSWFMTDEGEAGAADLKESTGLSHVEGAGFAPPGMVFHPGEVEGGTPGLDRDLPYHRFEVARDPVPDVVEIAEHGEVDENFWFLPDKKILHIHAANPGRQANVISTDSVWNYKDGLDLHQMSHYQTNIEYMEETGLIEDWDYARYEKDILDTYGNGGSSPQGDGTWDPIYVKVKDSWGSGGNIVGNRGGSHPEFNSAELWSPENDVLVGTDYGDALVGKSGDDLFYPGDGKDQVFGDDKDSGFMGSSTFEPGRDVAAYKIGEDFWTAVNEDASIVTAWKSEEYEHKARLDLDGKSSGQQDTLHGIEALHFIDEADSNQNILVANSAYNDANPLQGGAGNDYLFGGHGSDSLIQGGPGNDRIHGGAGPGDTARFSGKPSDYTADLQDWSLTVTNTSTGETDFLYEVENLEFETDSDLFPQDGKSFLENALTTEGKALGDVLLSEYSPVIGYKGEEDLSGNISVSGEYDPPGMEFGENTDPLLKYDVSIGDDFFKFGMRLSDEYLPQGLFGVFYPDGGDSKVQVRHPFSPEVAADGNHPVIWLDDGQGDSDYGTYLTGDSLPSDRSPLVDYQWSVMDSSGLRDGDNVKFFHNDGESNTASIEDEYVLNTISGIDGNFFGHDTCLSQDYLSPKENPDAYDVRFARDCADFEGDMELSYLFEGANAANLGQFDLA